MRHLRTKIANNLPTKFHMKHHLYRHFDSTGDLLYVGISLSAVGRLAAHARTAHWFDDIAKVTVENFESRAALEDAEVAAIRTEKPKYNRMHAGDAPEPPVRAAVKREPVRCFPKYCAAKYSLATVAMCFGVSVEQVESWVREGKLLPPSRFASDAEEAMERVWALQDALGTPREYC